MKNAFALLGISLVGGVAGTSLPALAADPANGQKLFNNHCATCHSGGNNIVNRDKTLQMESLTKNGKSDVTAIGEMITRGGAGMPGFENKLKPEQIQDVAAYVRAQAEKGWK